MKELCCIIFAIVVIQWVKKLSRNIEQLINEGKAPSFFMPKNVNEEECYITKFKYAVCKTCGKKLIYIPTAKGREEKRRGANCVLGRRRRRKCRRNAKR